MDNYIKGTALGIFIGVLLMAIILEMSEPKWINHARKAKAECEENIPRKETCVIIALPRSKE